MNPNPTLVLCGSLTVLALFWLVLTAHLYAEDRKRNKESLMPFQNGLYEVISTVTIRKQPRKVEYLDANGKLVTNAKGELSVGTRREIYSTVTNPDNSTWGRISEADAAGIALWVCIQGTNRTYMKLIEPEQPGSGPGSPDHFMRWAQEAHAWMRGMGFKGDPPF